MRLEAMQPTSIQDALIRAKPLVKEIECERENRRREAYAPQNQQDYHRRVFVPNPQSAPRVYAAGAPQRPLAEVKCFKCHERGHYRNQCPRLHNRAAAANGKTRTLKEAKDLTPTLTMPTMEEVVVEAGVEQPELMEMAKVVMPTMQDQLLRMKQMIVEESTWL